jgi:hypothetical protein
LAFWSVGVQKGLVFKLSVELLLVALKDCNSKQLTFFLNASALKITSLNRSMSALVLAVLLQELSTDSDNALKL